MPATPGFNLYLQDCANLKAIGEAWFTSYQRCPVHLRGPGKVTAPAEDAPLVFTYVALGNYWIHQLERMNECGTTARFAAAGLKMPADDLGDP